MSCCAVSASIPTRLDVVIFGGGAAGLWLLDELVRAGYEALLLEAGALGAGQTIASQGDTARRDRSIWEKIPR